MGGLACSSDRVCAQLQLPPPRRVEEAPPPRAYHRYGRRGDEGQRWRDGDPIPEGAHVESQRRLGLIIGGAVTFGVLWVFDWSFTIAACALCNSAQIPLSFIPVFGPFLQVATLHYQNGAEIAAAPFLVIDGLLQATGVGLLLGGVLTTRKVLVYDGPYGMQGVIMPMAYVGGGGLATMGTF
jgi:hypothetical protein